MTGQSEAIQRPTVYLEMGDLNEDIWAEVMSASQSACDPSWDRSARVACRAFIKPEALEKLPSELPHMPNSLPAFISPARSTTPPATHEFLLLNGALTLPSIPLQNALLEAFLEHVFPSAPVVEWQLLVATLADRQGRHGQISLLLFNAIMLSAIQHVELEHLLRAGYQSRHEAYGIFAHSTKLLYESGYETDHLVVLQALLLVALCRESFSGAKEWCRSCQIIYLAASMGIFKTHPAAPFSLNHQKLRKRLAWVCYMMDCLSAFRARCVPLINPAEFHVPMISVEDFDFGSGTLIAAQLCIDCVFVRDVDVQRDAASLCVSLAQLCTCVGELLAVQGRHRSSNSDETSMGTGNGEIHRSSFPLTRLQATAKALALWRDHLPPACQLASHMSVDNIQTKTLMNPSIVVQKCSLEMVYFGAVAVLHQQKISSSSVARTRHAALQITQIASELRERGLQPFLPVTGVTAILIAMIVHITNLGRTDPTVRHEAIKGIQSCQKTMIGLEEVFPAVRTASALISHTVAQYYLHGDMGLPENHPHGAMSVDAKMRG